MAELAYPGKTLALPRTNVSPASLAVMVPLADRLLTYSGPDAGTGEDHPSLRIGSTGFISFRLAIGVGDRLVRAQVWQPRADAARPFLRVRRNLAIGLAADAQATASSSTGWQELLLPFTTTAVGGIVLELWNPDPSLPCWFDTVRLE